ncbi:MAG: DUF4159 domain-containing protein [Verrucomicrobia bacterium]|nr:DUF4159 domain-containing protein [Verrucomicrobiota bacterium]
MTLVTLSTPPATGQPQPVTHYALRITSHASRITFYVLRFTFPALLLAVTLPLSAAPTPEPTDPTATFFMGRIKYSQNDGNDCGGVGQDLMRLVSRASTVKVQQEKRIKLTDPELFETPFLFMNGHNNFVLSEEEIEALKKYLSHGGFLFISGCCTNPQFPTACRREFSRVFPNEAVKPLPYDHPIYRSFYVISRIRSQHENKDIQVEGLFYQDQLVMVLCEDGLCCAFSMSGTCNAGKGINKDDGQKLALNIAVYSLTH